MPGAQLATFGVLIGQEGWKMKLSASGVTPK